jgi:PTS system mannose-specific IIC component
VILLDLLPFAVLGALFGLDVVSFPQAMLSRPIVAATIAGALAGSATYGMAIGAVLELFALEMLPVGAARYPEWGSASVVGGALFASNSLSEVHAGALAASVTATLVTAWAGGWSMYALRKLNGAAARRRFDALDSGSPDAVHGLQIAGLSWDLLRGALLAVTGLLLFAPVVRFMIDGWLFPEPYSRAAVLAVAVAVAGSATWRLAHGTARWQWFFLGGLAIGGALVLAR